MIYFFLIFRQLKSHAFYLLHYAMNIWNENCEKLAYYYQQTSSFCHYPD